MLASVAIVMFTNSNNQFSSLFQAYKSTKLRNTSRERATPHYTTQQVFKYV